MKLNITFKNVGQGDTIFIDWEDGVDNKKKYGLIDCNLVNGGIAPVIRHIQNARPAITEFEFVVMSHPHSDHFSGFPAFLEYCKVNGIIIEKFIFTSAFDKVRIKGMLEREYDPEEIIISSVNRDKHKKLLHRLYSILDEEDKITPNGVIKYIFSISSDYQLKLNDDTYITFYSPFNPELNKYLLQTFDISDDEESQIKEKENNPNANYLSTLTRISHKKDWQILLCSDVMNDSLERIMRDKNCYKNLQDTRLLAIQIPHHGSRHNHLEHFWQGFKEFENSEVIISVGERYKHPNVDVINFFRDKCKGVHSTNFVGGYKESFSTKPKSPKMQKLLVVINTPGICKAKKYEQQAMGEGHPPCCEKQIHIEVTEDGETTCRVENIFT